MTARLGHENLLDIEVNEDELVSFVLESMGQPLPSLQSIKDFVPVDPGDKDALEERIRSIKLQQRKQLEALSTYQAQRIIQHDRDFYRFQDEPLVQVDEEEQKLSDVIDDQFDFSRRCLDIQLSDVVTRIRIAHIKEVLPYQKALLRIRHEEERAKKRNESVFPKTTDEFDVVATEYPNTLEKVIKLLGALDVNRVQWGLAWGWKRADWEPLARLYDDKPEFRDRVQKVQASASPADHRMRK